MHGYFRCKKCKREQPAGTPCECPQPLTLIEAMQALRAGKCLRANDGPVIYWEGRDGTIRGSTQPKGTWCGNAEGGTPVLLTSTMVFWRWHIVEDKPKRPRVREMAEEACPEDSCIHTAEDAEEFAREIVTEVAKWLGERDRGVHSSLATEMIKAFTEPR